MVLVPCLRSAFRRHPLFSISACRRLMSDAIVAYEAGALVFQCSSPGASTCFEHHLGLCASSCARCGHHLYSSAHVCTVYLLRLLPVVLGIVGPTTAGGRSQGSRPHLVREGLYPMPNMNRMPYLCAGALDTFLGICTCIGSQRRCFLSKPCPAVCWHPSCPGQHILLTRAICRRSGHPVARATTMPQNPSDTWPLVPCP